MALPTIVTPSAGAVIVARATPSQLRTDLENYAVFRAIQDASFVEPLRPSRSDVADVAAQIRDWLPHTEGVNTFDTAVARKRASSDWWYTAKKTSSLVLDGKAWVPGTPAAAYDMCGFQTSEGLTYRMEISPGTLRFEAVDVAKQEKTKARAAAARLARRYYAPVEIGPYPEAPPVQLEDLNLPSRGEVTEWSAKSRSKMQYRIPTLDFSDWVQRDGTLAMVTLTLPGNWEVLVPDGKTFKKLVTRFLNRWRRAIGRVRGLWKLEFHGRGAPHLHTLMRLPALVTTDGGYGRSYAGCVTEKFEDWLSRTWADCVGASKEVDGLQPDGSDDSEYLRHLRAGTGVDYSGRDYTDPRRIAQYFAGHSSKHADGKEYQHIVPDLWREPGKGPGRFWGYWGFEPATVLLDIDRKLGHAAERIARKVRRAQSWKVEVQRTSGRARGAGIELAPGWQLGVEPPKVRKRAGGRAAHRTANLRRWWDSQQFQEATRPAGFKQDPAGGVVRSGPAVVYSEPDGSWEYQKRTPAKAMGAAGGFTGGWLQVNDGLALAFDLARALVHETTGPAVPPPAPGSRRDILQRKIAERRAD